MSQRDGDKELLQAIVNRLNTVDTEIAVRALGNHLMQAGFRSVPSHEEITPSSSR